MLFFAILAHGGDLDAWRAEATRVRLLAENDAPRAYEAAQSLQQSLPVDAPSTDRVLALNVLARAAAYSARTDLAASHAQSALALAHEHNDRVGQAEAELNRALISFNQGRINMLFEASIRSLALLDDVDRPDLMGEALLRTSMMYRRNGQFEQSVTTALQALEIAERSRNPLALTYAHQGLAAAFQSSGRHAEGAVHYAAMADNARTAGSKLLEADALVGLGRETDVSGSASRGEALVRQGVALYRQTGNPFSTALGLFVLAQSLRSQGRFGEAMQALDEMMATYERYPHPIGNWCALNLRGLNKLSLGLSAAARLDFGQAYGLSKQIGFYLYEAESARHMASLASEDGHYAQAYRFSQEAIAMMDKVPRERIGERMVKLAERYEAESKQREIDALTRTGERQAAELLERELRQRWLWTMLAAGLVGLASTVYFLMWLRRSNQLLERSNRELMRSRSDLQGTLDAVPDPLFEMSIDGTYHSCHAQRTELLVAPRTELLGRTVHELLPADAAAVCLVALEEARVNGISSGRQYELRLPSGIFWFELSISRKLQSPGQDARFVMLSRDITERKRHEALEELRLLVYQNLSRGAEMADVLAMIVRGVERIRPDVSGGVMVLSSDGRQLRFAAAPSLPLEFQRAIEQLPIGEGVGACGPGTALVDQVIAADVRSHPDWLSCKHIASRSGLMACWATPVRNSVGKIKGVLTLYLREPSSPRAEDLVLLRQVAYLVATVIERRNMDASLREMLRRLAEAQNAQRQLAARNEAVREEERRHLSRELHDEMGQLLTALRLGLSVVEMQFGELNPVLRERTQHLIGVVDATITVARNVVAALRPAALEMGIVAALEWLSQEFTSNYGVACSVTCEDECELVDEGRATVIFRIVQESLTNISRHAYADKAEIHLSNQGGELQLEVRDNGCGFDPGIEKPRSFGLAGIAERVHIFRGDFQIRSVQGEGTVIRARIPLAGDLVSEAT